MGLYLGVKGKIRYLTIPRGWFATTWQDGHVGGQYSRIVPRTIYVKIEFSSQRREMLLFLATNMAAVTSSANKQWCGWGLFSTLCVLNFCPTVFIIFKVSFGEQISMPFRSRKVIKGILLESTRGFRISGTGVDSRFLVGGTWVLDSNGWRESGFQCLGFLILLAKNSQILESGLPLMGRTNSKRKQRKPLIMNVFRDLSS